MTSFSIVRLNSASALGFRRMETCRANISTSLVVADKRTEALGLSLAKMSSAPEKRAIPCYERLNRKCELNQESSPTPGWLLPAICEQG